MRAEGQVRRDLAKSMENLRDMVEAGQSGRAKPARKPSPAKKPVRRK